MIEFRLLERKDFATADRFVDCHPDGRFAHLSAYPEAVEKAYGLAGFCMGIFVSKELRGLFPSILVSTPFRRKLLVSMPFSDYGGLLLAHDLVLSQSNLEQMLDSLLSQTSADYIKINGPCSFGGLMENNSDDAFLMRRDCNYLVLPLGDAAGIKKGLNHCAKKNINKAVNCGAVVKNDSSEKTIQEHFYPMYTKAMKHFGTPPHSLGFFYAMKEFFGDRIKLFSALHNGAVSSILWGITSAKRLHICYIASRKEHFWLRPNDLVHWEMIKWACDNGLEVFDFGVARYKGQIRFKSKWGAIPQTYNHYYYPKKPELLSMSCYTQPGVLNRIWSKCVPEPVAIALGRKLLVLNVINASPEFFVIYPFRSHCYGHDRT